jgi:hypothetical protein
MIANINTFLHKHKNEKTLAIVEQKVKGTKTKQVRVYDSHWFPYLVALVCRNDIKAPWLFSRCSDFCASTTFFRQMWFGVARVT